ncbi:MAG: 5,10-methylenetetrahydromethanopterin reductase [Chloroflexota bacterium]
MLKVSVLSLSRWSTGELTEFAENVEQLGFDSLWLADERFFREVYASLAYCATRTRTLELGVGVTDPYTRHPALTAMAIATLDEISGGRAILGLGAGVAGFEELGIERVKPARALREAAELVRSLLRGETVSVDGEVVHFRGGKLDFTPVRSDVPIYIASNNRLGLQAAGAVSDGAIMQGCVSPSGLKFFVDNVRTAAGDRQVDVVARVNVAISSDRQAARDAMRAGIVISMIAQQPRFWSLEQAGLTMHDELRERLRGLSYTHDPRILAPLAKLIPDEWVDAFTLAGDAEYVTNELDRISRDGATHLMLYPVPLAGQTPIDVVRTFARDVLPRITHST